MAEEAGFTSAGHGHLGHNTASGTTSLSTSKTHQHLHQQQHHQQHRIAALSSPNDDGLLSESTDAPTPALHYSHRQSHNSSKLPAFRSADPKTASPATQSYASLTHRVPASPVSPNPVTDGSPPQVAQDREPRTATSPTTTHRARDTQTASTSPSQLADPPQRPSSRSRASTYQASSSPPATADLPAAQAKRPASYPDSPANDVTVTVARTQNRRAPASRINGAVSSNGTPLSPTTTTTARLPAAETGAQLSPASDLPTKDWAQGQRELLLPKTLSQSSPPDEKRISSSHRAPPVSYKPPVNTAVAQSNTTPVRVPPIRGFRSSGSRKSLVLDMNATTRPYDLGDDFNDADHDHTLRSLEGRHGQGSLPMTPPASARPDGPTRDDSGDVFMRIAREEPARRALDEYTPEEAQTSVSRTMRSSHRRPLSTTVATYHPTSPPRLSRRLSDQQDNARSWNYDADRNSDVSRVSTYRSLARDRPAPATNGEDYARTRTGAASVLRPSALTSRSTTSHDSGSENALHGRRRPSMTDSGSSSMNRTPTYRSTGPGHGHTKSYNSSPLVRAYDVHGHQGTEAHQGVEGTESTASTTAPSTVWDELDDLKSRLHRLELTGKLPSTSGAAVSRLSDERPPTATTTVTTISSSPKRAGAGAGPVADATSITSSQREAHPILHSALTKSKPFLSPEVYRALESVANDAIGLSSVMGQPGQPGPISSGASTIGSGTTVTDRQLRRKADSVCRSLTELCVALGEEATQLKAPAPAPSHGTIQNEAPVTPTINKSYNGFSGQRRASVAAEQSLPPSNLTSPRTISKFEERRNTLLSGSALPSPRVINTNPSTPNETSASRRSSLLVSRTRRADTEEPDDGRRSSLLRSRRAGTEEPDEGRRTSVLVRNRRGTVGEDDEEVRFRAPSRANTEVYSTRGPAREYHSQAQLQAPPPAEASSQPASALPRRRFVSSNLNTSRLATPASYTGTPPRKYLERSTPERDNGAVLDQGGDSRGNRPLSLGPSMTIHRSGSLSTRRQNRDSTITNASMAATTGGYR